MIYRALIRLLEDPRVFVELRLPITNAFAQGCPGIL